jgi:hypothetical protein
LARTVIFDFRFADWWAFFGVLLNPIENLLFTVLTKGGLLPSLSWRLQAMRECRVPSADFTELRGQSNALTSALIEIGI